MFAKRIMMLFNSVALAMLPEQHSVHIQSECDDDDDDDGDEDGPPLREDVFLTEGQRAHFSLLPGGWHRPFARLPSS